MLYDFVVLLNGNNYISYVPENDVETLNESMVKALADSQKTLTLINGKRVAQIRSEAVLGWYFKPHEQNVQEKLLDTIKKQIDPPEDGWKHAEE
jgi:hypothetical protein